MCAGMMTVRWRVPPMRPKAVQLPFPEAESAQFYHLMAPGSYPSKALAFCGVWHVSGSGPCTGPPFPDTAPNCPLSLLMPTTRILYLPFTHPRPQNAFLIWAFGPPNRPYPGRHLRTAHLRLIKQKGFTVEHFEMGLKHFEEALKEMDAPPVGALPPGGNVAAVVDFG